MIFLNILPQILMFSTIAYIIYFFVRYFRSQRAKPGTTEWIAMRDRPPMSFERKGRMGKREWIAMLIVTAVYAVVAFAYLGTLNAPTTFFQFNEEERVVEIALDEPVYIDKTMFYSGIFHSRNHQSESHANCCYVLELSEDGEAWHRQPTLHQTHADTLRWKFGHIDRENAPPRTQFLRITLHNRDGGLRLNPLEMGELVLFVFDEQGASVPFPAERITVTPESARVLFDEQGTVPEHSPLVYNGSHFDEIYHAHTAFEHTRLLPPYENTHPPLGKLTTALGILIFDVTPFGWRFMPTLFGVLMLPMMFILIQWMFGKMTVSICGTVLFAFDFMHFVQTRISTIDVYAVFYIIGMFLFMYWYITVPLDAPFRKTVLPFMLAGLFFGLGAASKWSSIYAGVGLFALFMIYQVRRYRYYGQLAQERLKKKQKKGSLPVPDGAYLPFCLKSIAVGLVGFIAIPLVIYTASYIPYALASPTPEMQAAESGGFSERTSALLDATVRECWGEFGRNGNWGNQGHMHWYHTEGVAGATHGFSSRWFHWVLNSKPILYSRNNFSIGDTQMTSTLLCLNNPLIAWAGLLALIAALVGFIRRNSMNSMFIWIGFLSNFVWWVFIERLTFAYHYFPSLIFLVLALCYVFDRFLEREPVAGRRHMFIFTGASVLLFALFYPALTGLPVPVWYIDTFLRWIPHNWLGLDIGWVF